MRLWKLFGIPIRIDPSWYGIAAFVAWSLASGYFPAQCPGLSTPVYGAMGLAASLLLFGCVLLHELGHALAARRLRIPVTQVTLFLFGGVSQLGAEPRRPSVELRIALAGPLVSAWLAGLCWLGADRIPLEGSLPLVARVILRYLAAVNVGILVFNLLPGFPLDGGRVLRAAVWAWTGSLRRATRLASRLGAALGLGLLGLGLWVMLRGAWVSGVWYVFLGFFLREAAQASLRRGS
jgi:Zn-dependent protease